MEPHLRITTTDSARRPRGNGGWSAAGSALRASASENTRRTSCPCGGSHLLAYHSDVVAWRARVGADSPKLGYDVHQPSADDDACAERCEPDHTRDAGRGGDVAAEPVTRSVRHASRVDEVGRVVNPASPGRRYGARRKATRFFPSPRSLPGVADGAPPSPSVLLRSIGTRHATSQPVSAAPVR